MGGDSAAPSPPDAGAGAASPHSAGISGAASSVAGQSAAASSRRRGTSFGQGGKPRRSSFNIERASSHGSSARSHTHRQSIAFPSQMAQMAQMSALSPSRSGGAGGGADKSVAGGAGGGGAGAGGGGALDKQAEKSAQVGFFHVNVSDDDGGIETKQSIRMLQRAIQLREKYVNLMHGAAETMDKLQPPIALRFDDGIMMFTSQSTVPVPWETFYDDITALQAINSSGLCTASCRFRLQALEEKFNIHRVLNSNIEDSADPLRRGGGVFGAINRVDNNIRLAASMSAMHLVRCIQEACEHRNLEVVRYLGGSRQVETQTLRDLMNMMSIDDPRSFTVEGLGLHPPSEKRFSRFDPLDPEVNRNVHGATELLKAFLSRETANNGRLFADVVRPIVFGLGSGPGSGAGAADQSTGTNSLRSYEAAEFSIPVAGQTDDEWEQIAKWVMHNRLLNPYGRVMWVIEIPRISARRAEFRHEFQQKQLECFFGPLFLATLSPDDPKYADIATFLLSVGGFYITSDEEARKGEFSRRRRPPRDVPWSENVCDLYFTYYVWANLVSLNAFRRRKGLNTFQLRCAAGERSTQLDSVLFSYLLCDNVSHGVLLGEHPVLQYLYGYHKIGIAMSPLSNNAMDVSYLENPFPSFFRRGLTVTLCSDSPLHHHHHDRALLEEYGTASKIYKLSAVDVAELARTSVILSSFSNENKINWIGEHFSDVTRTCVPHMRLNFREDCWTAERQLITALLVHADGGLAASPAIDGGDAGSPAITLDGDTGAAEALQLSRVDSTAAGGILGAGGASPAGTGTTSAGGGGRMIVSMPPGAGHQNNNLITFASQEQQQQQQQHQRLLQPQVAFPRLHLVGPLDRDPLIGTAGGLLHKALELRQAYVWNSSSDHRISQIIKGLQHSTVAGAAVFDKRNTSFDENAWVYQMVEGVFVNHGKQNIPRIPPHLPKFNEFAEHIAALQSIVDNRVVKALAFRRLNLLEHKYRLHHAISHSTEAGATESKVSQNRDFYQTTKVDTAVRMETGMTSRQLLNFIVGKAQNSGDDIVSHRSGEEPQTLRQLLKDLHIDPAHLTVDDLNVQVDAMSFRSNDQFRQEGRDPLLTLLLKTQNEMNGRYFAELTKLTFDQFQRDKYTFSENRLTVYGASEHEWDRLSNWFDTHGMACYNNEWMIQFPRIYGFLRKQKLVTSFAHYLQNLFDKLWKVTLNPAEKPRLFHFLNHVSGFDCVEDESREEVASVLTNLPPPQKWTSEDDPPYNYYLYYLWINIRTLNEFRAMRDFSTYSFRPSCGEAGSKHHLLGGFLLANAINYGVNIAEDPSIQYLFYLAQIGVSVSPLSNNMRALEYLKNPFPTFFRRGLNVSLSTDSPLQVHHTQEPLIEEYSVASKVWKLSPTDMCEIARNSVLQSGFSHEIKQNALGQLYFLASARGNDSKVTHLSDVRVAYRYETYHDEIELLEGLSALAFPRAMFTPDEEENLAKRVEEHTDRTAENAAKSGIIAASTDEAEISRMRNQRSILTKQLNDAQTSLESLKEQNRKLFDSLNEAVAKESALEHSKQSLSQMVEAAGRRLARTRQQQGGGGGGGVGSPIDVPPGQPPSSLGTRSQSGMSGGGGGGGGPTSPVSVTGSNVPRATFNRSSMHGGSSGALGGAGGGDDNALLGSGPLNESANFITEINEAVAQKSNEVGEGEGGEMTVAQQRARATKTLLSGSENLFGRDGLFGSK